MYPDSYEEALLYLSSKKAYIDLFYWAINEISINLKLVKDINLRNCFRGWEYWIEWGIGESKLEVEGQASIIFSIVLESESKTIGSRGSETGDEVLVFELNSVIHTIALFKINAFRMEEDSVKLDINVNGSELSIISGSSKLNK